MSAVKIGSLFSGIGGLELGLERATGAATSWQVEIDPFCRRVLERHWPHATRYEDVRTVGAHNLEPVDIICGGFPCQDLSVAGKGAGLDGERSGLFFEYVRIIRELRPRVVVMENVAALLVRGLGRVLGELAACGYDAEWDCVPAAAVGAPHRRDRVFIVTYPGRHQLREQSDGLPWSEGPTFAPGDGEVRTASHPNGERPSEPWTAGTRRQAGNVINGHGARGSASDTDSSGREWFAQRDERAQAWKPAQHRDDADRCAVARDAAHAARPRLEGRRQGLFAVESRGWGQPPSAIRRVDAGLSAGMDRTRRRRPVNDKHRLRALGNAVVPQVAEVIGRRVAQILEAP